MDYKQLVADALALAMDNTLLISDIYKKIERPKVSSMGDYAFPTYTISMIFKKAPQQIAVDLVKKIDKVKFENVQAAGPYINFFLDKEAFSTDTLSQILDQGADFGQNDNGHGGNVPIDMSSPNIAKPISMGHLRSTVIGNSLAEILKKNGYNPIKDNHLGDWGTQFGKLIVAYLKWGNEDDVKKDPITNLVKYYVKFHQEDKKYPELDNEAREWFKKLEEGDKEAISLWSWFREESLKAFNKIYNKLGVTFDTYKGESFYNNKMQDIIDDLKEKNLLKESQGAQVVNLSKYNLNPALILKRDGASLYITRDIATAVYRDNIYHPVMSLYVVGSEQTYYFQQLKAVLTEMGLSSANNLHHIPFGLIAIDGKKLSTRSGRIILLDEVLEESIAMAKKQIAEKNPNLQNKEEVAKQVGVGAVIFGDLNNERMNSIDFNLDDQLKFEGTTGPYVQYARARAESILRKKRIKTVALNPTISDPDAWEIVKTLADFPMIVEQALGDFEPSYIAKYSIRLAKSFNKYYAHSRILANNDKKSARLALVKCVSTILKESLRLLGVQSPDKM